MLDGYNKISQQRSLLPKYTSRKLIPCLEHFASVQPVRPPTGQALIHTSLLFCIAIKGSKLIRAAGLNGRAGLRGGTGLSGGTCMNGRTGLARETGQTTQTGVNRG